MEFTMKNLKKVAAVALTLSLCMAFMSGCQSKKETEKQWTPPSGSETESAPETTTEETTTEETTTEATAEATTEAATEATTEATTAETSELSYSGATEYPVTFTDVYGNTVTIKEDPKKIVSCSPAITEILFSLGQQDSMVGRTDLCNYPEDAAKIKSVISELYNPNIETIASVEPDLILADSIFPKEAYDKLTELGYTVAIVNEEKLVNGVYNKIKTIGQMLDANDEAEKVVTDMKAKIEGVKEALKDLKNHPSVYYVVGFGEGGDYTATGETFINEILETAGCENIAKSASGYLYNVEDLISQDPNIIILPAWADQAGFKTTAPYSELTAVKEGNVIVLESTDMLDRQCARNADAVEMIAKLVFPECFEEEKAA